MITIPATEVRPGDIIHVHARRWRVATATPRKPGSMEHLVDVDATGVDFAGERFASYRPDALVTIERPAVDDAPRGGALWDAASMRWVDGRTDTMRAAAKMQRGQP